MNNRIDWSALLATMVLIVSVREIAVWVMSLLGYPKLGNLIGLASLLVILIGVRYFASISPRLVEANNRIMKDGLFAFLPTSGGSLFILMVMGAEIPMFLVVLLVSTLIPMWVYAKMAKKWLV